MTGSFAFISYAHEDHAYVGRLGAWLRQRNREVFVDYDIERGSRWDEVLRERVESCTEFVLVMSPAAGASDYVKREVQWARSRMKSIRTLLLEGEPILDTAHLQYEAVHDGRMPSDEFVATMPLRTVLTYREPGSRVRHLVGTVPNAADCFQERDVLAGLYSALIGGRTAPRTQILTGLGGVGKTQMAAAVARNLVDTAILDALVWVTATSREDVISTYAQAGHEICGADISDHQKAAQSFLGWMVKTTGQWLVVLDDVGNPADVAGLWPPASISGRVIVTTRRRDAALGSRGQVTDVGLFTPDEARNYLAEKFVDRPDRIDQADELVRELGFLPLMLAQAASFIADQDITCTEYRRLFAKARRLLDAVPSQGEGPDDYLMPVSAALQLSVDAADRLRPAGYSRPLLTVLSLLDPNGIPGTLVAAPSVLDFLRANCTVPDSEPVDSPGAMALACLRRLSIAESSSMTYAGGNAETRQIRVHAIVQRAVRDQSSPEFLAVAAHTAADALMDVWPQAEWNTALAQMLRANAYALRGKAENHLWAPRCHLLLVRLGRSLGEAGLIAAAAEHFDSLAVEAAERLGPDHADTLTARSNCSTWRGEAGNAAGAASTFDVLLRDHLRVLGPDHPDTLTTRGSRAYWRGEAGDAAFAVNEFEALIADRIRVLGPDHADTLRARHNLAFWRWRLGDSRGAVATADALLDDYVRVLGTDHPDTLTTHHNVVLWRANRDGPAVAAAALSALLGDFARGLGSDHPQTLSARHNIALWLGQSGGLAAAVAETRALLADYVRVLGDDHHDTLTARRNLAYWLDQEARDRAGPSDVALSARELLPPDEPRPLTARHRVVYWREQSTASHGPQ